MARWGVTLIVVLLLAGCEWLDESATGAGVARAPVPTAATVASAPRTAVPPARTPTPGPSPTPTATPGPSPTPTITPTPTPRPSPPPPPPAASGYRRFTSTLFTYGIDYLETWRGASGGATFEAGKADLFVGDKVGAVTSTVTVFSQPLASGAGVDLFMETSLAALAVANITPTSQQERTIGGANAHVFSYTMTRGGVTYAVVQALFVRQEHGWVLTLTTAPEELERLQPVFTHMLDSFAAWG